MRSLAVFLVLAGLLGAMVFPTESLASKKKDKAIPVKIVKASETKFKHAKIVQGKQKKAKKKKTGFLWFKKKEPKIQKPKVIKKLKTDLGT